MIKYKYWQKPGITEAHLTKVTKGKQIASDEDKGSIELCYSLSNCLITLRQLNYESNIYRADTLCQTTLRLSNKFYSQCGEPCLTLRRMREPRLVDTEA